METEIMKHSEYSVVIVGSGVAGLYAASDIAKQLNPDEKILLITKSPLGESNSRYAQGGIACVSQLNRKDSVEQHIIDTLKAGAELGEKQIIESISKLSEEVINDLILKGVNFDKDINGEYIYSLAGAHSIKRVLHCCNDATGKEIVDALIKSIKSQKNIDILEKTMAVEILTTAEKECAGVIIFNKTTKEHAVAFTSNLIIATGGIGQIYKYTTNPYGATGDGIALAYEAGADVQDMEFIQFHPTALVINPNNRNRFLISEAVRGEGGILVNNSGEKFMYKYNEKKELASRDIVTRAIFSEMKLENVSNVYLDISDIGYEKFINRFPHIAKKCKINGIDITKNLIPIAPAAHYIMGGVKADINGSTSIKGLYVIGEAASTGFHGANRLACNSLLECAVCAYELSKKISINHFDKSKINDLKVSETIKAYSNKPNYKEINYKVLKDKLRDIMWNEVGIIRSEKSLSDAKKQIQELKNNFTNKKQCFSFEEYEYRNMLTIAELIIESAIKRHESRGAHFNKDFPKTENIAKHSIVNKFSNLHLNISL